MILDVIDLGIQHRPEGFWTFRVERIREEVNCA